MINHPQSALPAALHDQRRQKAADENARRRRIAASSQLSGKIDFH